MSFQRYPGYKDSGVEWLGELPAHWEVRPIKALATLKGGAGFPDAEQGIENEELYFYKVAALSQADAKGILQPPPDSISRGTAIRLGAFVFPAGSLTFAKVGAALLLARIRQLSAPSCLDNNMMGMLVNKENDARFALFAMSLVRFDLIANPGAVPSLNASQIGNFQLALPPRAEQTAIVTFLDHETAKIDALVAEQEKLIALLQEKRQAVISHAVTKGLDPNVPMKDSGVEWLGEVPAHWGIGTLTRIAQRVVVGIAEAATHAYVEAGTPILRSTNIRPNQIQGEILYIDPEFAKDRGTKEIFAGDLVTVRTGNAGVTAVVPQEFDGCQCFTMLVTTLNTENSAEYYSYWMNSYAAQNYFSLEGWGTAQVNISVPILKSLPVPIPPLDEQQSIVSWLKRQVHKLDELISSSAEVISLLRDRRTALISAAVTGQIDVRDWTPEVAA